MPDGGQPGKELAAPHQWAHQPEVVEMRAASVGIVEDKRVAGLKGLGACGALGSDLVDHGLDRKRHGTDEDRQSLRALHEGRAGLRMVEPVAGIARLRR